MATDKKATLNKDEEINIVLAFLISSDTIKDLDTATISLDTLNKFEKILIHDCSEEEYETKWKERIENCRNLIEQEIESYSEQGKQNERIQVI